jgi:hypothetical protein
MTALVLDRARARGALVIFAGGVKAADRDQVSASTAGMR